jgi:pimeloyl-ACP methyl ester carboxylesterase
VRELWSQPKNFICLGQQVAALPASAAQAAAASSLGDLPMVVLSGDHHSAPYAAWQRDLALLCSRGRQLVVNDSGHWIHLDHPEVVTSAIRQVVTAARSAAQMDTPAQTFHNKCQ